MFQGNELSDRYRQSETGRALQVENQDFQTPCLLVFNCITSRPEDGNYVASMHYLHLRFTRDVARTVQVKVLHKDRIHRMHTQN